MTPASPIQPLANAWVTAVIAAGPVALYYVIALIVLPSQFQRFAVNYMRKHPELEAQALDLRGSQDGGDGLKQN